MSALVLSTRRQSIEQPSGLPLPIALTPAHSCSTPRRFRSSAARVAPEVLPDAATCAGLLSKLQRPTGQVMSAATDDEQSSGAGWDSLPLHLLEVIFLQLREGREAVPSLKVLYAVGAVCTSWRHVAASLFLHDAWKAYASNISHPSQIFSLSPRPLEAPLLRCFVRREQIPPGFLGLGGTSRYTMNRSHDPSAQNPRFLLSAQQVGSCLCSYELSLSKHDSLAVPSISTVSRTSGVSRLSRMSGLSSFTRRSGLTSSSARSSAYSSASSSNSSGERLSNSGSVMGLGGSNGSGPAGAVCARLHSNLARTRYSLVPENASWVNRLLDMAGFGGGSAASAAADGVVLMNVSYRTRMRNIMLPRRIKVEVPTPATVSSSVRTDANSPASHPHSAQSAVAAPAAPVHPDVAPAAAAAGVITAAVAAMLADMQQAAGAGATAEPAPVVPPPPLGPLGPQDLSRMLSRSSIQPHRFSRSGSGIRRSGTSNAGGGCSSARASSSGNHSGFLSGIGGSGGTGGASSSTGPTPRSSMFGAPLAGAAAAPALAAAAAMAAPASRISGSGGGRSALTSMSGTAASTVATCGNNQAGSASTSAVAPSAAAPAVVPAERGCIKLQNKPPHWNETLKCWCLNFRGRVKMASIKNFQLMCSADEGGRVVLQFGKVSDDTFILDFNPCVLSSLQAFSVALTTFETKYIM